MRFSVKLLLVLISAVAILLGLGQMRRQRIDKACRELEGYGVLMLQLADWQDDVWPRQPWIAAVDRELAGKNIDAVFERLHEVGYDLEDETEMMQVLNELRASRQ
jgi:hypothetical protein